MHACTGTMYICTCVHRVLCTHVVYVVVRMAVEQLPCTLSSMCACRILLTAQRGCAQCGKNNSMGNGNTRGPVFNTIAKRMLGYYTQLWH